MTNLQVFQGAAESVKQAASEAKDAVSSGGLPSAPSIGLPKVNLPKLTPTIFSDSGDIDPRAVALPGQQSLCKKCNFQSARAGYSDVNPSECEL